MDESADYDRFFDQAGGVLRFGGRAGRAGGDQLDRWRSATPADDEWDAGWDEEPSFDYGPDLGTLTMVVLINDTVVDTVRRPVRDSGYECAALELGRGAPAEEPRVVEVPAQPRHELERAWLRRLVGGAGELDRLSDEPLPDEPLDASGVPDDLRDRVVSIVRHVDEVALRFFGAEARTACRRLLVRAVAAEPALLLGTDRDDVAAGAVLYAVAKGNDLAGPGCALPATALWSECGLRSSPHDRARRFAHAVAGPVGVGWGYGHAGGPDVLVLGSPDLLLGRFRRQLIMLRDLAAAEAGAAG